MGPQLWAEPWGTEVAETPAALSEVSGAQGTKRACVKFREGVEKDTEDVQRRAYKRSLGTGGDTARFVSEDL